MRDNAEAIPILPLVVNIGAEPGSPGYCLRQVLSLHRPRKLSGPLVCAIGHFSQLLLNAQIALGDLLLDLSVVIQRLAEHEEQLHAVIARQRHFNLGLAFLESL